MIYVSLSGGLGNQLFQFAAAYSLALQFNTRVGISTSILKADVKDITKRDFELDNVVSGKYYDLIDDVKFSYIIKNPKTIFEKLKLRWCGATLYIEEGNAYSSSFEQLSKNAYISGYFQSLRYFEKNENTVFETFSFPRTKNTKTLQLSDHIQQSESYPVFIHVRRGDYVTDPKTNTIHGVCDMDYYQRAIESFKNVADPEYYFFSDDMDWVRSSFSLPMKVNYVDWNSGVNSWQDLYLMSLCKGAVIANSSFSWWGAMLSRRHDKRMIAPVNWFADRSRKAPGIFDTRWNLL